MLISHLGGPRRGLTRPVGCALIGLLFLVGIGLSSSAKRPPQEQPAPPAAPPSPATPVTSAGGDESVVQKPDGGQPPQGQPSATASAADEAERADEAMLRYELAKAEYHAAAKLNTARRLFDEAEKERKLGRSGEAERLLAKARDRNSEVVELYPDTEAAEDARRILQGESVPSRPIPPAPSLPKGITASEDDVLEKPRPASAKPPAAPTSVAPSRPSPSGISVTPTRTDPAKTVHVRAYTRKDGTPVKAHTRSHPGSGGGRRR